MDKISIKNLEIFAKHGVFPEENVLGQKFIISAELYLDLRPAGLSDDLSLTVNYGEVCGIIVDFVEGNTWMLLETVVERLAEELLLRIPLVKKVSLELKKPWAPIARHVETVAVSIERMWHTAYIALGSNIGDKQAHLKFAVAALDSTRGCRVLRTSSFIQTAPYGYLEQDDFLNGCLALETLLTPQELLDVLHEIEQNAMRERTVRWGPRTLDLDIIFYDELVFADGELQIPHIEAHKRDFVLAPLCEIAPYYVHPVFRKTIRELLAELTVRNNIGG